MIIKKESLPINVDWSNCVVILNFLYKTYTVVCI